MGNKYNAARPKNLAQKKAKGNKKTNKSKQKTSFFFVITQKNQSPFFCNIFKEKKSFFQKIFAIPSLKDLTRIPPSPFKNTYPPSIQYTVWDREIGALCSTPISMFQTVPSMFFIVRSVLFQLKLSMFQLPSVTKLFFFFWLW